MTVLVISHENLPLFWKLEFHYRVHEIPQLDAILKHLNLIYTLIPYLFQIQLNVILPCKHFQAF